jgi:hypothetical protein
VDAVVTDKVAGFKKYVVVSEHPQRWVDIKNAENELKWSPVVNIKNKFNP